MRVDDEGCAVSNAVLVQDAEGAGQLALEVGCHDDGQVHELLVGTAPCVVGVLVIDGNADNLAVAGFELVCELTEGCDLGGAHEGEVLRPEENDAPGVLVQTLGGDSGEVVFRLGCFDVSQLAGDNAGELVCGELIADGQNCHGVLLSDSCRAGVCTARDYSGMMPDGLGFSPYYYELLIIINSKYASDIMIYLTIKGWCRVKP